MSGCDEYQELISRMIDEELSQEESAVLAEHLKGCTECTAMYNAFKAISCEIAEDMEEPPAELHVNVMAEICRAGIKEKNRAKLSRPFKSLLAAAACFAVIIMAAFTARPMMENDSADTAVFGNGSNTEEFAAPQNAKQAEVQAGAAEEESVSLQMFAEPSECPDPISEYSAPAKAENLEADSDDRSFDSVSSGTAPVRPSVFYSWGELSDLLSGESFTLSEGEELGNAVYTIAVDCQGNTLALSLYDYSGGFCYYDPIDGNLMRTGCSRDALDAFLAGENS